MKTIFTGSRRWSNVAQLEAALAAAGVTYLAVGDCPCQRCRGFETCHRECPGVTSADAIAYRWARRHGIRGKVYRADWKGQGRKAGPVRNSRMVAENKDADLGLAALVDSEPCRGTRHCMGVMRAAFIDPQEIHEENPLHPPT
jgi:hypothetical protein